MTLLNRTMSASPDTASGCYRGRQIEAEDRCAGCRSNRRKPVTVIHYSRMTEPYVQLRAPSRLILLANAFGPTSVGVLRDAVVVYLAVDGRP